MNRDKANLGRLLLYFLPVIGILTVASYWRMLDNFFYSDDFEWLDQVKNLEQNPLAIFNPVVHPATAFASTFFTNIITNLLPLFTEYHNPKG